MRLIALIYQTFVYRDILRIWQTQLSFRHLVHTVILVNDNESLVIYTSLTPINQNSVYSHIKCTIIMSLKVLYTGIRIDGKKETILLKSRQWSIVGIRKTVHGQ